MSWFEMAKDDCERLPVIRDGEYYRTRNMLSRGGMLLSASTLVIYAALVATDSVRLDRYRPETNSIDVIGAEGILALVCAVTLWKDSMLSLTIGNYLSMLAFMMISSKFWVYSNWSQAADTACVFISFFAAIGQFVIFQQLIEIDTPKRKNKFNKYSILIILKPYFKPTGWKNKLCVLIMWIIMIVGKAGVVVAPLFLGKAVTQLTADPVQDPTLSIGLYCVMNVVPQIALELQDVLYQKVAQTAYAEVAEASFRHVHTLSLDWHLRKKMGNVLRSMDRGLNAADTMVNWVAMYTLPSFGAGIAAFVVFSVHFHQPNVAAVCYMGLMFFCWITYVITLWRRKFRTKLNEHDNDMHDKATDSLINFETVKYFANEDYEASRYVKAVAQYQSLSFTSQASVSFLNITQNVEIQLTTFGALVISAYMIMNGETGVSAGNFVAIQAYIISIFAPLSFLGSIYTTVINSIISMENLSELLLEGADVVDAPDAVEFRLAQRKHVAEMAINMTIDSTPRPVDERSPSASIEFKHVSFHYPTMTEDQGLHDITFTVPAGTTTAIVGKTGSGKTTIFRLLYRFYDVHAGQVLIGNQDVSKVTQQSLRRAIGIVPQDTCLFNDTIAYNIKYGDPNCSQEQLEEVTQRAQLMDFVMQLDQKWDSMVGERGLKLSGGEKQRVAIARCLLKDPPIVVLDEATSALDNKTEKEVQQALSHLGGRTTLVIAHRLTTIQAADQILVMKAGRIIERGKHDELLADPNSEYYSMWNAQLMAEANGETA